MSISTESRDRGDLRVLFAGLGLHKFYLGQSGLGVLYLLFCWTLVPSFVGVIETIVYLSSTDESFNAKYNAVA